MANELDPNSHGPGRLLGAISLGCMGVTLVIAVVAAVMASDILARTPPGAGGGLQDVLTASIIVLLAVGAAALTCVVGAIFALAGLVLAVNHPRGRPVLPAVGLVLNGLPMLTALILYWLYS